MARTITDEEIKLSIIINGNPAQKQLLDLEKSTRKLTEENKSLNIERRRLEAQGKKDTDQYKALTLTIKANTMAIDNNKAKMNELRNQIGISALTLDQLRQKAVMLRATLKNLTPDSADFKKFDAELKQVTARLGELSGKAQTTKFSLSSIADNFNKYQALGFSIIASLTGVVLSIQKIIDLNGKLSDTQADVMKTTGMTKDEVNELTKSFGLLETRTSRIDLLKIAEQGGRIGIAKAEIGDFVKEMNMANVALGDSFTGGVEEVANKLGKLKFLFQETKDANIDTAYSAIGSAINELGANGVASEANITEFATRLGSLPNVLKPSIKEALALGAAFEESGIEAEVSSRAYNIFMKQASTESAKFAKVMGISEQAVKDMINTNPLDFMMKFAEGMKGMDATETARTLDFLGVNADGANKVIGAMGNNMGRFKELIDISNNSFNQGSSLIQEYEIKNNNLAATLEKVGKKVNGWFSSEGFNNWLFSLVNGFARLIGATEDVDGSAKKWRNTLLFTAKVIAIVISAMITNISWQKLVALWTTRSSEANLLYIIRAKARTVADAIGVISTQALAMAQMLLAGNLKGATQAFRVMTATMMTTPWGFIFGAISAIGTAYLMFSENAKEAATSQSMIAENAKEIEGLVNKESSTFLSLMSIVNDLTASTEARSEALKKAKVIGGEYTTGLTLENAATFEGKKMIDAYINSLQKKMTLQVLEAKQKEIIEKIQDRKMKSLNDEVDTWDKLWYSIKHAGQLYGADATAMDVGAKRKKQALIELQNQLKFTNDQMKEFLKANPNLIKTIDTGDGTGGNAPEDTGKPKAKKQVKSLEEMAKERLDFETKTNDDLLKLERQYQDDSLSIKQDGITKELALENQRYQREIADLERQKVHSEEMAKLDVEIAKAKADGDTDYYNFKIQLKKDWQKKNEAIDAQITQIQETKLRIHNLKLATIYENAEKKRIEEFQKSFEHEKMLRETAFNNQLALLGNNEKAKEALKKEYDQNELTATEEHLKKLIKIIKANMALGDAFNLLNPVQKKKLQDDLDFALNALSKIQAAKTGEKSKGDKIGDAAKSAFGQTDILGFSPQQWQDTFNNISTLEGKLSAVNMVVTGLQNMWSAFSNLQTASENRNLKIFEQNSDKKKLKLKRQLDAGYITQAQYDKQIKKLDDEYTKQKLEAEYKQAKRDKAQALFGAIVNTAKGITAAIPNPFLMSLAAIVGGLQIATIAKTPLPARGFEEGLYPVKREQDGKIFQSRFGGKTKSGLVNKPTYFLTGENGPEMIIDSRAYSQISPETKNALLRELRGIKGFENGLYNQSTQRFEVPAGSGTSSNSNSDEALRMNTIVMAEVLDVLKDLRDNPVHAIVDKNDKKSMKNIKEGVDEYKAFRDKNKF
jgi:TP901 family phage tail tape measure protein